MGIDFKGASVTASSTISFPNKKNKITHIVSMSSAAPEPNSPGRESQSPPPEELSAVHDELLGLAHALYNLGTTVLEDLSKDAGVEKPVGARV